MKPYLSPAAFKVFAHRGSTEGGAAENTLRAFQFAADSGVVYIETDVQATKDGVAVLFHDKSLKRLFGVNRRISDFTFQQLQELELADGSRLPKLLDVLERLDRNKFNLDIKTRNAGEPALDAITKAGALDRVLVSSFSRKRRLAAIHGQSRLVTSADGFTFLVGWLAWRLGIKQLFRSLYKGLDALQIPVKSGPVRFDSSRFIRDVHNLGIEIHYWTINELDEVERLRGLGADGIVTDRSKIVIEALNRRGSNGTADNARNASRNSES